jgi:DNA helicase-2/ATP-dependent DNA helicase PcrA
MKTTVGKRLTTPHQINQSKHMEKKLPPLNKDQQEAVDHTLGPCIVLAGPGAGKTAVLTRRASKLVISGVSPERILLLTFTRAASKEMLERAKLLNPLCEKIDGGTFHSIAARIVNQNSHLFGRTKPFTILDVEDNHSIIKKISNDVKGNLNEENWPSPSIVQRIISFSTNTRMSISDSTFSLAPTYTHLTGQFETIRDQYFDYKINRGLLDYDDCLEYFSALLNDDDLGPKLRTKWDYVMIDEYQDTNQLQLDIVYGLVGNNKNNVFIVGDPGQSIFSFRGSAPETMTGFKNRFPKSRIINLENNYRSSPEIVDVVNSIDRRLGIGFNRTLKSNQPSEDRLPQFIECGNSNSQASEIAINILESKKSNNQLLDNVVIVRSMAYARPIEVEFTKRKIPYKIVGGLRIDEAAHVKDLLSIARISTNPQHEPAWLRILTRIKKLGNKAASDIVNLMSSSETMTDVISILENYSNKKSFDFGPLINSFKALDKPDLLPNQKLDQVIAHMEPSWSEIKEWKDDWKDRKKDLESIVSIAVDHPTVESFLSTVTLDYSVDSKNNTSAVYQDDMVTITTVHGSKGLEWNRVHIPSFVSGHIPSSYTQDMKEEMRILYVAASRAKKDLMFYKPLFSSNGSFSQESEFESLIKPYCDVIRVKKNSSGGMDRINSNRKIDMRSVFAAKLKNSSRA